MFFFPCTNSNKGILDMDFGMQSGSTVDELDAILEHVRSSCLIRPSLRAHSFTDYQTVDIVLFEPSVVIIYKCTDTQ